jgi:hypothetical protein
VTIGIYDGDDREKARSTRAEFFLQEEPWTDFREIQARSA